MSAQPNGPYANVVSLGGTLSECGICKALVHPAELAAHDAWHKAIERRIERARWEPEPVIG